MRVLLGLALFVVACGGGPKPNPRDAADANDLGRTVAARTPGEQSVLQRAADLPAGSPQTLGDSVVVAEPSYQSASGRTCRLLRITQGKHEPTQRLACSDGAAWFFVPDVLGLEAATATP